MKKTLAIPLILLPTLTSANYLESANFLAEKNIIVNNSENPEKYNLEKNILRQEIAGIIAKMSKVPEKTTCENKFSDVKITENNSWACLRIESLLDAGIIAPNKKYNPESFVTKAESLGFILKGLYREEYENFSKNNSHNSWEINAKNFAISKWILTENISNLQEKASRWFIFQIMKNALNSENKKFFSETNTKIENKNIKTENKWWTQNSGSNTSFTGNGNENIDWGAIYDSEARANIQWPVNVLMEKYNWDKAKVERVLRKNFQEWTQDLEMRLKYLESL